MVDICLRKKQGRVLGTSFEAKDMCSQMNLTLNCVYIYIKVGHG